MYSAFGFVGDWTLSTFHNLTKLELKADCRFLLKLLENADNLEILIFWEVCWSSSSKFLLVYCNVIERLIFYYRLVVMMLLLLSGLLRNDRVDGTQTSADMPIITSLDGNAWKYEAQF